LIDPEGTKQYDKQAISIGIIHDDNAIDHKAKSILSQLSEKGIRTLEPRFEHDIGFRYADLEGLDLREQLDILHQFEKEGLVTSELSDTILRCPECESTRFSLQLSCTVCKSSNVTRGAVIEHLLCGNIDFDGKYGKDETNVLVCPKCGKRLKAIGVDYARPGIFYRCLDCKALLPQTENAHTCLKCTKTWNEADLKELHLMKYAVDLEKASQQFVNERLLPLVAELLSSKEGIRAESPGKIKGLSKVEHTFDLLVSNHENGEPILAADLLRDDKDSNRMDNVRILAFYAKCLDANYSTSNVVEKILVTHSELEKEAKELAAAYGITVIQTTSPDDLTSIILERLAAQQLQE
jgi:TackOD1 domain-containing protein